MKLLLNALIKFTCGLLLVGVLLFLPAGTLAYSWCWVPGTPSSPLVSTR